MASQETTPTQNLTICGATGSVGESTLSVVQANPGYRIFALTANQNTSRLIEQCTQFAPRYAVIANVQAAEKIADEFSRKCSETELLIGSDALDTVCEHVDVDVVMAAIVGAAGLQSSLAAVNAGKRVLLANKESLVMSGHLFMQAARASGAIVLPIDSEHNAVFQCLPTVIEGVSKAQHRHVSKIVLTASGGPFLNLAAGEIDRVTPEQACKHPKWSMGRKISVDSATMMNKGLEFIEACFLFELQPSEIEVVIHPQSIVHSMVYYRDGSVMAQLASPDMRVPIASGLAWPERIESGAKVLDLTAEQTLEFRAPDLDQFPCLRLGMEAAASQGTMPTVLNAANEVAVEAFLANKVGFSKIPSIIAAVMSKIPCEAASSLAIIRDTDTLVREVTKELISKDFC